MTPAMVDRLAAAIATRARNVGELIRRADSRGPSLFSGIAANRRSGCRGGDEPRLAPCCRGPLVPPVCRPNADYHDTTGEGPSWVVSLAEG